MSPIQTGHFVSRPHFMEQLSVPCTRWNNDRVCSPTLPQPDGYSDAEEEGDERIALMMKDAPASQAIIDLTCGCRKDPYSINYQFQ